MLMYLMMWILTSAHLKRVHISAGNIRAAQAYHRLSAVMPESLRTSPGEMYVVLYFPEFFEKHIFLSLNSF